MTKKPDRKKRIEHIYATTSEEVDHVTLTFDQKQGEIGFAEAMTNVYSQISYERPKGPKVLSRIPHRPQPALPSIPPPRCLKTTTSYAPLTPTLACSLEKKFQSPQS